METCPTVSAISNRGYSAQTPRNIEKIPRSDVQAVEIKKGVMPEVHFVFQDGTHYVLMCPRIHLGKLKKVQELLVTSAGHLTGIATA